MMKNTTIKAMAILLTISLLGCSGNAQSTSSIDTETNSITLSASDNTFLESSAITEDTSTESPDITKNTFTESSDITEDTLSVEENLSAVNTDSDRTSEYVSAKDETEKEFSLTEKELNSFSMLYYLAITAEQIRTSKNNRLILDDIYTSLLNDINPGAIDERTQEHLENLRDIIKSYTNISIKRERLQYIYNQNKAAAIRSVVPNPLSILSISNSLDWKTFAISVVYSAVDSYTSYKSASENADKAFIMSGWELDDEEKAAVEKNRDRAFNYMVDMVQQYGLDGKLTLNEKHIANFAEICQITNTQERIHRLESEETTYKLLGNYWLELAESYFDVEKYKKCLECIDNYNALEIGIYRQDFNYVQVLPKAIVAAQNVYTGDQYIETVEEYTNAIIRNTANDKDSWSTRYFAAQVYLDLYSRTNNPEYLQSAFKIAYDNVTVLLQSQRDLNSAYLKKVETQKVDEPDYSYMSKEEKKKAQKEYKDEKKRVEAYNDSLKEERKTELPPLYEPLVVNCELLFGLAEELQISDETKADIEAILGTEENGIFLTKPLNDTYSFSKKGTEYKSAELTKKELIIPANLLTSGSTYTISVSANGQKEIFDDCKVTKVERKDDNIDSFDAHVTSKKLKKHEWTTDSKVTVDIVYGDAYDKTISFNFVIDEKKDHWYGDKVVFKEE